MNRREFLALTSAAIAPTSLVVAQDRKVPLIAVLMVGAPSSETFRKIFEEAMRGLGYVDGRTAHFEYRSDRGETGRLPELAAELVRLKPEVIVTWFTPTATAAKQATHDIPIVMAAAADPIATGLVASLARPGGNVTGTSGIAADLAGKCVELIREILPAARRVVALVNPLGQFSKPFFEAIRRTGEAIGITVESIVIHSSAELEPAFAALPRPDAMVVQPNLPITDVVDLALKYRMPTASPFRPFAEAGGLMSYWLDERETYGRTAVFVDKILKGAKPADLPVEQATRFELVINLKTAKALGLTVPQSLLIRTDEVIE